MSTENDLGKEAEAAEENRLARYTEPLTLAQIRHLCATERHAIREMKGAHLQIEDQETLSEAR
jgi:hypothetical protein